MTPTTLNQRFLVPRSFDEYVAQSKAIASPPGDDTCDMCGAAGPLLDGQYCAHCLQKSWGYDQGEEFAVQAMLEGAIKAVLERGVRAESVRLAVDDAIADYEAR